MINTQKNINGSNVEDSDGEMSTLDWVLRSSKEEMVFKLNLKKYGTNEMS